MRVAELRINNLVYNKNKQICTIHSLFNDNTLRISLNRKVGDIISSVNVYKIELTKDYVLDFYFQYDGNIYSLGKNVIRFNGVGFSYWYDGRFIKKIQSVHELQNAYYFFNKNHLSHKIFEPLTNQES